MAMTLHHEPTPRARNRGPGAATLLVAAALAAACLGTEPAGGRAGQARATDAAEASGRDGRHAVSAGARLDTLDYAWEEVFPIAVAELEKDDWGIQRADSAARRIVTRWQPIEHGLARLAFGDMLARCVVDLQPIEGGRTQVNMRGGLTSRGDLAANPFFGKAQSAFRKAAARYVGRVRAALAARPATATRL